MPPQLYSQYTQWLHRQVTAIHRISPAHYCELYLKTDMWREGQLPATVREYVGERLRDGDFYAVGLFVGVWECCRVEDLMRFLDLLVANRAVLYLVHGFQQQCLQLTNSILQLILLK